jgi:4-diphosphocytidyl-2-C-methyl-D-erythritol kinase
VSTPLRELTLPAPAKVNLFLHVTGRRDDGYHLIESLFAPIDLADSVLLRARDDGRIRRIGEVPGVPEHSDLTIRAAHALRDEARIAQGVDIDIDKRIPMGAGLGGGSSDAATVLVGLNALWRLHWPRDRLARIGLRLGADVPFFLGDGAAFAHGIGEVLTPVSLPRTWIALATPALQVSTAEIFAAPDLTRTTPSAKINIFSESYGRNDLQAVAAARFAEIRETIQRLTRASASARLTGSGASVIATFADEAAARDAIALLPPGVAGRVVRTLDRLPLATFDRP